MWPLRKRKSPAQKRTLYPLRTKWADRAEAAMYLTTERLCSEARQLQEGLFRTYRKFAMAARLHPATGETVMALQELAGLFPHREAAMQPLGHATVDEVAFQKRLISLTSDLIENPEMQFEI